MDWIRLFEVIVAAAVAVGYVRARLDRAFVQMDDLAGKVEDVRRRLRRIELDLAYQRGRQNGEEASHAD